MAKHPVPSELVFQGSAKRALELGYEFYNNGKPCVNGHDTYRRAKDWQCITCAADNYVRKGRLYRERHPMRKRLNDTRTKCQRKGIPFDEDAVREAWEDRPIRCPVLGITLSTEPAERHEAQAELDRLVPDLGYVRGNIRVISARANRIKNDGTAEEHRLIAAWMEKQK